ncbi:MAG TPA: class I SAM-dependent methyltransferase, partial [Trueperaceae bacterium]|nr:class I SAM-dependent methyltransferase [Trueperaceae bacterium]
MRTLPLRNVPNHAAGHRGVDPRRAAEGDPMTLADPDRIPGLSPSGYDRLGEFHDLFVDEARLRLRPAFESAFGRLEPSAVVLDLGAGTGLGVRHLARATRARIVAVEPSVTMRAVLLARVADDPALASRVT